MSGWYSREIPDVEQILGDFLRDGGINVVPRDAARLSDPPVEPAHMLTFRDGVEVCRWCGGVPNKYTICPNGDYPVTGWPTATGRWEL